MVVYYLAIVTLLASAGYMWHCKKHKDRTW
jgi:hypothetical protein